jgi:hypothetical protein
MTVKQRYLYDSTKEKIREGFFSISLSESEITSS